MRRGCAFAGSADRGGWGEGSGISHRSSCRKSTRTSKFASVTHTHTLAPARPQLPPYLAHRAVVTLRTHCEGLQCRPRYTARARHRAQKQARRDTRPSGEPENAPARAWRTASPPAPPARPRARSSPPPKRTRTHTSRARRGPLGERPRRLGARPERGARRPARPARAARARCGAIFFSLPSGY